MSVSRFSKKNTQDYKKSFMKILDLGCGKKKVEGAIGIDRRPEEGVDVVWDLDRYPYPFEDNEFDMIICNNSIEHLEEIVRTMEEIWRMLKHGGILKITTPHFSSDNSYTDPTHKHHLSVRSFDYFTGKADDLDYISTTARFELLQKRILFPKIKPHGFSFHKICGIEYLVNRIPRIYEKFIAFILPANEIVIELRAVKGA